MWWWTQLPVICRRVARLPAAALLDGLYLWAWPAVARYLSPVALVAGFVIGYRHPGYQWVFSESLALLLGLVALGVLSAHLGTLFLAGYIFTDALVFRRLLGDERTLKQALIFTGELLILYSVLAAVLVVLPLLTRALLAPFVSWRMPNGLRVAIALIGHGLITGFLVFLWINSTPLIIRPLYTWSGYNPTVAAMVQLQTRGTAIIWTAILASAVRMALQARLALNPIPEPVRHLETVISEQTREDKASFADRMHVAVKIILRSGWTTLLFGGLYSNWTEAGAVAMLTATLSAIRLGVIKLPLQRWAGVMERIPLLLRLFAGIALMYVIGQKMLAMQWHNNTFRPFVIITTLSLLLFFLLNPALADARRKESAS